MTSSTELDASTLSDLMALAAPDPDPDFDKVIAEVRDPNSVGFPAMLPMELAMKFASPREICTAYGITKEQFSQMCGNPVFIKAYAAAVEALKIEGMSFKVKAQMAAEEYLKTAFSMVKNPATADSVRADLIKSTVRWAGWDAKAADTSGGGSTFAIQINLG